MHLRKKQYKSILCDNSANFMWRIWNLTHLERGEKLYENEISDIGIVRCGFSQKK